MKPILMKTEMVRAILDGRKTVTRRVVKFKENRNPNWTGYIPDGAVLYGSNNIPAAKSPYSPGDVFYVRETWQYGAPKDGNENYTEDFRYYYAADGDPFMTWTDGDGTEHDHMIWRPSIHMPREAARVFLRVKNVRVERLQEISHEGVLAEGISECQGRLKYGDECSCAEIKFSDLWDSTIKPADRERYGWAANPFCWVISFERISKDEAMQ